MAADTQANSSNYYWTDLESHARRVGLFDEANNARERQYAIDNGYPYVVFRGSQTSGNLVMFGNLPQSKPAAAASPKPANVAPRAAPTPSRQLSLLGALLK